MALTQQFARVTPEYLAVSRVGPRLPRRRPLMGTLRPTTSWTPTGRCGACSGTAAGRHAAHPLHAALDRALSGDADGDIGFLDHDEVYDGCSDPPRPPAPAAVDEITRALLEADIDQALAGLPDDPAAAASAVGFQGFRGDVRSTWSSSSSR
ncbi:DUF1877 domain-containing protein [Streptomyces mirabilis]